MNHREKQSVAAAKYREAKKEAHRRAKEAARIEYNRVYTEICNTLKAEYMSGISQKGDTDLKLTRENLDAIIATMEEDEDYTHSQD